MFKHVHVGIVCTWTVFDSFSRSRMFAYSQDSNGWVIFLMAFYTAKYDKLLCQNNLLTIIPSKRLSQRRKRKRKHTQVQSMQVVHVPLSHICIHCVHCTSPLSFTLLIKIHLCVQFNLMVRV